MIPLCKASPRGLARWGYSRQRKASGGWSISLKTITDRNAAGRERIS